jgi:zinc protease
MTFRSALRTSIFVTAAGCLLITQSFALAQTRPATGGGTPPSSQPTSKPASVPAADLPKAMDLIHSFHDAIGGLKNVEAVESISLKATVSTPMGENVMDLKSDRHGQFSLMQGPSAAGSDGKIGWAKNPMAGGYQLLEPDQIKQIAQQLKMFSYWLFLDPGDNFETMETVDKTDLNGKSAYKVRMVAKGEEKQEQFWFFDPETKMLSGVQISQESPMGPVMLNFTFDDWKPIDSIKLYSKMMVEQMGQQVPMTYSEVQINKVEPGTFDPPAEVKELLAKKDHPDSQPASQPASNPSTRPSH